MSCPEASASAIPSAVRQQKFPKHPKKSNEPENLFPSEKSTRSEPKRWFPAEMNSNKMVEHFRSVFRYLLRWFSYLARFWVNQATLELKIYSMQIESDEASDWSSQPPIRGRHSFQVPPLMMRLNLLSEYANFIRLAQFLGVHIKPSHFGG